VQQTPFIQGGLIKQQMTTCLSNESHPFTTPVPSFILKPRGEKDNILCGSMPQFVASETTFGRGLRIRSSFDEEDGESSERRGRAKSLGELLPGVAVEPPEWAVRACGEARLEVRFSLLKERLLLTVVPAPWSVA
jgi:hypothetical protein